MVNIVPRSYQASIRALLFLVFSLLLSNSRCAGDDDSVENYIVQTYFPEGVKFGMTESDLRKISPKLAKNTGFTITGKKVKPELSLDQPQIQMGVKDKWGILFFQPFPVGICLILWCLTSHHDCC